MFKFVKYMFGVALIATTSFLAQDIAFAGGGFSTSCTQVNVTPSSHGWDLNATCRAINQSLINNHLPLNPHIANDNGKLIWRKNGGFSASSSNCIIQRKNGTQLACTVKGSGDFPKVSYINLDDEIANNNGHLTVLNGF